MRRMSPPAINQCRKSVAVSCPPLGSAAYGRLPQEAVNCERSVDETPGELLPT
jgi:hypothetical protein